MNPPASGPAVRQLRMSLIRGWIKKPDLTDHNFETIDAYLASATYNVYRFAQDNPRLSNDSIQAAIQKSGYSPWNIPADDNIMTRIVQQSVNEYNQASRLNQSGTNQGRPGYLFVDPTSQKVLGANELDTWRAEHRDFTYNTAYDPTYLAANDPNFNPETSFLYNNPNLEFGKNADLPTIIGYLTTADRQRYVIHDVNADPDLVSTWQDIESTFNAAKLAGNADAIRGNEEYAASVAAFKDLTQLSPTGYMAMEDKSTMAPVDVDAVPVPKFRPNVPTKLEMEYDYWKKLIEFTQGIGLD